MASLDGLGEGLGCFCLRLRDWPGTLYWNGDPQITQPCLKLTTCLAFFVTRRACRRCHNASQLLLVNQSCESYVNHRRLFIVLGCDMVYDIVVLIKCFNIRLLLFNILTICLYSILYFEFSILYFVFYCYLLLSFNFFCFCLACTFETFAIKYYLFTYLYGECSSQ